MQPSRAVSAVQRVRYVVDGHGRSFGSRMAAYRHVANRRVIQACIACADADLAKSDAHGASALHSCRYCSRTCADLRGLKHYDGYDDRGSCEQDPTHTYRYRLVGRLARWLRWRDGRAAALGAAP